VIGDKDMHLTLPPTNVPEPLPEPQRACLDNGLRIVVTPQPHLSLTSMILLVRVGSRYEDPIDNGLSHLLEHVLFRGCAAYPDTHSLNAAIESVGTALDAATAPDYTTFEAVCLPERLPATIAIVGAMIGAPNFTGVDVEQRILSEELEDEDDARGRQGPPSQPRHQIRPRGGPGLQEMRQSLRNTRRGQPAVRAGGG